MTVYVAIWEDRHSDPSIRVFSTADRAILWARETVREYDRFGELDETLNAAMIRSGWLYYGKYSCEGDNIRVEAKVVDEA